MVEDPALIWQDEPRRPARRSSRTTPTAAAAADRPGDAGEDLPGGRVTLREAHHQFGVATSTLAGWARSGKVNAVKHDGLWMVTPASVAARLSGQQGDRATAAPPPVHRAGAPGPTTDGSAMLVPRDAWDKLMDQLGNLHQAGQMLAEARERAAKAETEASFLRERMADLRTERDDLRARLGEPVALPAAGPGFWTRLRRAFGSGTSVGD